MSVEINQEVIEIKVVIDFQEKGDAFTYEDFTPEQIQGLQQPATDAATVALSSAETANQSAERAENAVESAVIAISNAVTATENANNATTATNEAISNAVTATENANTATLNANEAIILANEATENANEAAENAEAIYTTLFDYENIVPIPDKKYYLEGFGLIRNGVKYYIEIELDVVVKSVNSKALELGFSLPKLSRQIALSNFISGLKKSEIYSKLDVLYIYSYNDLNSMNYSRINILNTALIADYYGGITYNLQGIKGNSVDGYVDLKINFGDGVVRNYKIYDASRFAVVSGLTSSGANSLVDSLKTASYANGMYARPSLDNRINHTSNPSTTPDLSGLGFKCLSRSNRDFFDSTNKDADSTHTIVANSLYSSGQILLARGVDATTGIFFGNIQLSMYGAGSNLAPEERQTLRNLFNIFLEEINLEPIA